MKKIISILGMLLVATVLVAETNEVKVSGNVELLTGYVFKGATYNDGMVLQPSVTIENWVPVDITFWANMDLDDWDDRLESGQFSEVDMTLSKSFSDEHLNYKVIYNEFWYPDSSDETEREISLKLSPITDLGVKPYIAPHYMIDGAARSTWYYEAGFSAEVWSLTLDTAVGYFDNRPCGCDGWSHYSVGLTKNIGDMYVGVTYIGQIDDEVLKDAHGPGTYVADWIGRLGYNF